MRSLPPTPSQSGGHHDSCRYMDTLHEPLVRKSESSEGLKPPAIMHLVPGGDHGPLFMVRSAAAGAPRDPLESPGLPAPRDVYCRQSAWGAPSLLLYGCQPRTSTHPTSRAPLLGVHLSVTPPRAGGARRPVSSRVPTAGGTTIFLGGGLPVAGYSTSAGSSLDDCHAGPGRPPCDSSDEEAAVACCPSGCAPAVPQLLVSDGCRSTTGAPILSSPWVSDPCRLARPAHACDRRSARFAACYLWAPCGVPWGGQPMTRRRCCTRRRRCTRRNSREAVWYTRRTGPADPTVRAPVACRAGPPGTAQSREPGRPPRLLLCAAAVRRFHLQLVRRCLSPERRWPVSRRSPRVPRRRWDACWAVRVHG